MNESNDVQKEEIEQIQVTYDGDTLRITDPEKAEAFYKKGFYGNLQEDGQLVLSMVETLLNLERQRIFILDDKTGEPQGFQDIVKKFVKKDKNLWTKYLVYKDLRNRGYVVREGFLENTYRIYDRGAKVGEKTSKFLVSIILEGLPLKLTDLEQIVKSSKSMRKNLVLAVIDRQGETTYYKCSSVNL
ncbi:MAG: tRNA-intron lyase [Candidatus Helarchaeota archaeon]